MQDLMIDIETMSSDTDAAMIQLGAVFFDRKTGETDKEFCRSLDLKKSIELGFKKSSSTEKWWSEQNQDVLNLIFQTAENPEIVISDFSKFFTKDCCVWSHATFDFPIVQNYLKKFNAQLLPYRGARDIRTLVDLSGINLNDYDWNKKTHDALDDCKFQISYCVDAMKKIRA